MFYQNNDSIRKIRHTWREILSVSAVLVIKIKNALLETVTTTLTSANASISISDIGGFQLSIESYPHAGGPVSTWFQMLHTNTTATPPLFSPAPSLMPVRSFSLGWDRNVVSVLAGLPCCAVREVTETETGSQTYLELLGAVSSLFCLAWCKSRNIISCHHISPDIPLVKLQHRLYPNECLRYLLDSNSQLFTQHVTLLSFVLRL